MIDVESKIYDTIAKALREKFPGINVSSTYVHEPPKFPHVSIVEADNYITNKHISSSDREQYATLMYEVNVYSNKASAKKSECRAIIGFIDEMMYRRNFKRLVMTPVPNMENATIYRITARYRAETDGKGMYRI